MSLPVKIWLSYVKEAEILFGDYEHSKERSDRGEYWLEKHIHLRRSRRRQGLTEQRSMHHSGRLNYMHRKEYSQTKKGACDQAGSHLLKNGSDGIISSQ
jgi:hypothetical protein